MGLLGLRSLWEAKFTAQTLDPATLSFSGAQQKAVNTGLVGAVLNFSSAIQKAIVTSALTGAVLSFTGSGSRQARKVIGSTLSFMSVTGNNLFTVNQASFEISLNSWNPNGAIAGASTVRSSAFSFDGTWSIKCTILETSSGAGAYERGDIDLPRVFSGQTYVGSVWVYHTQASAIPISIDVVFLSGGNYLDIGGRQTVSVSPSTWTRISTLAAATPAGATQAGLQLGEAPAVNGDIFYFDAAQLELHTLSIWSLPVGLRVQVNKVFVAAVSFVGSFIKFMPRILTAVLSFTGVFTAQKIAYMIMAAALNLTGAMTRRTNKGVTAVLSFAGSILKRITKGGFTAGLSFVGSFTKQATKPLLATLTFSGASVKVVKKIFTATLSITGAFSRRIQKALNAALGFVGGFISTKVRFITFAASMTATASVTFIRWYVGAFKAGSRATFRAVSRAISNYLTKDRDTD